jgi:hypothetical protein
MHAFVPNRPAFFEWRCRGCRALLGLASGGLLRVKYRDVEHRIRGFCQHTCRRCGTDNDITVEPTLSRAPTSTPPQSNRIDTRDPR